MLCFTTWWFYWTVCLGFGLSKGSAQLPAWYCCTTWWLTLDCFLRVLLDPLLLYCTIGLSFGSAWLSIGTATATVGMVLLDNLMVGLDCLLRTDRSARLSVYYLQLYCLMVLLSILYGTVSNVLLDRTIWWFFLTVCIILLDSLRFLLDLLFLTIELSDGYAGLSASLLMAYLMI